MIAHKKEGSLDVTKKLSKIELNKAKENKRTGNGSDASGRPHDKLTLFCTVNLLVT